MYDPFTSTHLSQGATGANHVDVRSIHIYIHVPLTRCDNMLCACSICDIRIYIHAPLARCDTGLSLTMVFYHIYIHAPLARCDINANTQEVEDFDLHPRTSCEVRLIVTLINQLHTSFTSTHLLRGATCDCLQE